MGGSHRTLRGTAIPKVTGTGTFGCQRGYTKKAPRFVGNGSVGFCPMHREVSQFDAKKPHMFETNVSSILVQFYMGREVFGIWLHRINLGGGFKYFFFLPPFGEDEPILTSIFFNWVVQPPTRNWCLKLQG